MPAMHASGPSHHNRHPSIHTDYNNNNTRQPQPSSHHHNNNMPPHHNQSLRPPTHQSHYRDQHMPHLDVSPRSGGSGGTSNGSNSGILMSPHSSSPTLSHDPMQQHYNSHAPPAHYNDTHHAPYMPPHHPPMSHAQHQHMIAAALHADMDTRNESEREADRLVYMERMQCLWEEQLRDVQHIDFRHIKHTLPLARIKKIMKSDEDVRMISAEAPVVFAKACELFILDLTTKAWQQTYAGKRRTLNKGDVAEAIAASDIFDFLEPVVPKGSYDSSQLEEAEEWNFDGVVEDNGLDYDNSYDSYPNTPQHAMPPPNAYYSAGRTPSNGSIGSNYSGSSSRTLQYNNNMPSQHYDNRHAPYPTQQHHRAPANNNNSYNNPPYKSGPGQHNQHYDQRRSTSEMHNVHSGPHSDQQIHRTVSDQYNGDVKPHYCDISQAFQPLA